jgi:hypothetical protein
MALKVAQLLTDQRRGYCSLDLFSDFMHGLLQVGSNVLKITQEFRNYFYTKEDVYDK